MKPVFCPNGKTVESFFAVLPFFDFKHWFHPAPVLLKQLHTEPPVPPRVHAEILEVAG